MPHKFAICYDDILAAADRIKGHAVRTPLLEFEPLNEKVGRRVLVKFEGVQRTGSFKFRGAYNRLSALEPNQLSAGVVAWSSGNHAQGVAAAAKLVGTQAAIVMPEDAPAIKLDKTKALGAEVITYDRYNESREAIATALAEERGAILVPSYNDPFIIAGQGTAGLEIVQQAEQIGATVGTVLTCCGGGGLTAGIATAVKHDLPNADIYSVEPDGFDSTARSMKSGELEGNRPDARSICDALQSPLPGEMTLAINRRLLAGGLAVTDAEVTAAVRFAFEHLKLVVEPGGAAALAAALHGKVPAREDDLALVISGSNVDPSAYAKLIGG